MLQSVCPDVSEDSLKEMLSRSKDFGALFGILKFKLEDSLTTMPHTLFPSPFPAIHYNHAIHLQKLFNILYQKVSSDHEFLSSVIKPAISQDSFLNALWNIYSVDYELKPVQKIKLSLNRSDYMLHAAVQNEHEHAVHTDYSLKQVEFNLIASGCGGHMERIVRQHQFNLSLINRSSKLPPCPSSVGFAKAMIKTQEVYIKSIVEQGFKLSENESAILVVISDSDMNVFDQRSLEFSVLSLKPQLNWLRRTFQQLSPSSNSIKVDSDKRLFVDGFEIALIYYRTGYAPQQFNDQTWETKLLLERTMAIKCPSIDYLLANTKLIQTALAQPGILAQFVENKDSLKKLSESFAKQTFLSNNFVQASVKNIKEMIADCYRYPDNYVLKPQREGGGNNIFGGEIIKKLDCILGTPEANAFILMEKLRPPIIENCVVGLTYPAPLRRQMVSEMGIFGVILSKEDEILENSSAGHFLRSKFVGTNEGGIATGFACIDSPFLI